MSVSWGAKCGPRQGQQIQLLVELPSRRRQFFGNLRTAFGPAGRPLPFERRLRKSWFRPLCASGLLHVATLLWMFVLSGVHRDSAVVVQEQPPRSYTLIYTPAESLLPMEDGGSQAAASRGTRIFRRLPD